MRISKILKYLLFVFCFIAFPIMASNVVIELVVTNEDNEYWHTENKMHTTLAFAVKTRVEDVYMAVEEFNMRYKHLLQMYVEKGFVVEKFTTEGFGKNIHMLEADDETTKRFNTINKILFFLLEKQYSIDVSEYYTPKIINPEGYTPHIIFLETDKIPVKGDVIHFKDYKLQPRIQ